MADDARSPHRSRRWIVAAVAAVVVILAFLAGALPRIHARHRVRQDTANAAVPYVTVIRPAREATAQELVLPGSVQAYASAPIFARTSGYLVKWNVDIGARVKQDQVLAVIAIPEVEQQLQQARGTLANAEANLLLAEQTATRFTALRQTRAVSQQEVDNAVGQREANRATVAANRANVRQLAQQLSYAQIRAPFDGTISQRNVDVGDLINSGSSTAPNTALFEIVQSETLRVYVTVPEVYAGAVQPSMTATLTLAAFPNRKFTGTVVRNASAIDPATRTMQVQIEVKNAAGTLFAGAFAEVSLNLPAAKDVFMIPVEALLFRKEGLQVATVSNDRAVLKAVVPGRDFGDRIEIASGLSGDEQVIISPPDSIADGVQLRIAPTSSAGPTAASR